MIAALALVALMSADPAPIVGSYMCSGVDAKEAAYTIALSVQTREKGYWLKWVSSSGEVAQGLGLLEGNVLSVAFTNGEAIGVAHYVVSQGTLDGHWWIGTERLPEMCRRSDTRAARR